MNPTPKVKICCISSVEEAERAIGLGASALGLVSAMPSGPGVIEEAHIAEIAAAVPPSVATFLLTSLQATDAIIAQHHRCPTTTIQLVDQLEEGTYADLRAALPGVQLVQVIHVTDAASIQEAETAAPHVDALLLDSGNPNAVVKTLGGTGNTHDWALSRQICDRVDVPVFLAGGLRVHNVAAAIEQVQPFGLDLCTGVRTDGQLDEAKLRAFMDAVRA